MLLENEIMPVTSILSFYLNVSYNFVDKFHNLCFISLLSANAFELDKSKILSSGKKIHQLVAFSNLHTHHVFRFHTKAL